MSRILRCFAVVLLCMSVVGCASIKKLVGAGPNRSAVAQSEFFAAHDPGCPALLAEDSADGNALVIETDADVDAEDDVPDPIRISRPYLADLIAAEADLANGRADLAYSVAEAVFVEHRSAHAAVLLAQISVQEGRFDDAVAWSEEGLRVVEDDSALRDRLADLHHLSEGLHRYANADLRGAEAEFDRIKSADLRDALTASRSAVVKKEDR